MKKIMTLLITVAMTTLFAQANSQAPLITTSLEMEAPVPIEGDTNGTNEESAPGR